MFGLGLESADEAGHRDSAIARDEIQRARDLPALRSHQIHAMQRHLPADWRLPAAVAGPWRDRRRGRDPVDAASVVGASLLLHPTRPIPAQIVAASHSHDPVFMSAFHGLPPRRQRRITVPERLLAA